MLIAALALMAAAAPQASAPSEASLLAVAKACKAPRNWLWIDAGKAMVRAPSEASYAQLSCLFAELQKRGIPTKTGRIVG